MVNNIAASAGYGDLQRIDSMCLDVTVVRLVVAMSGVSAPVPSRCNSLELVSVIFMIRPVCSFLVGQYNILIENYHNFLHPVSIRLV